MNIDDDQLRSFADQIGADPESILDRWQGRPDLILDDVFSVTDLDTGEVRDLQLFDVQRRVVDAYFYGDAATLNAYKGRRIGYSFVVIACFLLEAIFIPGSFYPLVSRTKDQAKNRISDIQDLIDNAKIKIPTNKENTDYIELWNGSSFMAYSADADTSRGDDSARAVLMDEMAFMEDEESAYRAFGAFLALGSNRKMVEVSTPNTKNDLFMQEFRSGSASGDNGIISIKQPTFANADEIDIQTSLYDQPTEAVRPDFNLAHAETQRKTDPEGFAQEYLCRPVSDEYRFFSEDAIQAAQARASDDTYARGLHAGPTHGHRRVMGVDIGINRDDTVVSVVDHHQDERYQRFVEAVDNHALRRAGLVDPDRSNPNDLAAFIAHIYNEMSVDIVIVDQGGVGRGFPSILRRKIGRNVVNFDFSDKEGVADMMGDMNAALHDDNITLVPNDRLFDELSSIVKEKRDQYTKPRFSGKDYSESGKDDMAMATALSAFPPHMSTEEPASPAAKERDEQRERTQRVAKKEDDTLTAQRGPAFGAQTVDRSHRSRQNTYTASNSR